MARAEGEHVALVHRRRMQRIGLELLEDLDTIRKEMLEDALNSESSALGVLRDIRPTPLGLAGTEKQGRVSSMYSKTRAPRH